MLFFFFSFFLLFFIFIYYLSYGGGLGLGFFLCVCGYLVGRTFSLCTFTGHTGKWIFTIMPHAV